MRLHKGAPYPKGFARHPHQIRPSPKFMREFHLKVVENPRITRSHCRQTQLNVRNVAVFLLEMVDNFHLKSPRNLLCRQPPHEGVYHLSTADQAPLNQSRYPNPTSQLNEAFSHQTASVLRAAVTQVATPLRAQAPEGALVAFQASMTRSIVPSRIQPDPSQM